MAELIGNISEGKCILHSIYLTADGQVMQRAMKKKQIMLAYFRLNIRLVNNFTDFINVFISWLIFGMYPPMI